MPSLIRFFGTGAAGLLCGSSAPSDKVAPNEAVLTKKDLRFIIALLLCCGLVRLKKNNLATIAPPEYPANTGAQAGGLRRAGQLGEPALPIIGAPASIIWHGGLLALDAIKSVFIGGGDGQAVGVERPGYGLPDGTGGIGHHLHLVGRNAAAPTQ